MAKALLRYNRLRRTEPVNTELDDLKFQRGRYFEADCLVGDVVTNVVYVTGPEVSGFPQVSTADVTQSSNFPVVGLIVEKSTPTRCVVQRLGETDLISTTPGSRYWISKTGFPTPTPPSPDLGEIVMLQVIGTAIGSSRLLIQIDQTLVLIRP